MSTSPRPARHSRLAIAILIIAALAAPAVLFCARRALKSTSNDPRQWLPRTFAETDTYDWFQDQFGTDEIAVVSWPGCDLDDPRVGRLSEALKSTKYFDHILNGQAVLDELTAPPLSLSRTAAKARLRGILIGAADETTCLVLRTSQDGKDDRSEAVEEIERQALQLCQIPPSELRLAGPTVDAAAIDAESRRLLFQLAGLSAIISFLIASLRMRSIRMALSVLSVAAYSTAVSLAILYISGGKMNLLMTMLPPLVYVLTISSAVHLANYYLDAARDPRIKIPPAQAAIARGWLPCSLAAGTTGVGLASLVLSKIEPIQSFGIYSAVGVIVSVAVLFLMLPAALHLFPPRTAVSTLRGNSKPTALPRAPRSPRGGSVVNFILRHHMSLMLGCLALMVICGSRIPAIESTVRLQDRFLPSSDAIKDYVWLEKHVGPMVPLEVVIRIDADDKRDRFEQIQLVSEVQRRIQSLDEPVATMSAVNLCPPLPRGKSIGGVITRKIIRGDRTQQRLVDANFLRESADEQLWRITVRANALGDLDYGYFVETIRKAVAPILSEQNAEGTFTGVIPLIYKAQRQLLLDLFRSFVVAFGVIAAVLVVVLRGVVAALLAMIPNIFPAIVVFGGIEWINVPVQIGSVMTASAALGIAVDDTVHVLTWFRRGMNEGMTRRDAIQNAFAHCAGAMVHTTLICAGGLIVFALSTFVPILHFAWLMVFLLLSALLGDLVLLPAILASPLGRYFETTGKPLPRPESPMVAEAE